METGMKSGRYSRRYEANDYTELTSSDQYLRHEVVWGGTIANGAGARLEEIIREIVRDEIARERDRGISKLVRNYGVSANTAARS